MKLRNFTFEVPPTSLPMLDSRCMSFGHVLFKFVKSTHTPHFPKDLGTMTIFASQVVMYISLMNLVFNNFSVSCFAAFCFSNPSFLFFCATSQIFRSIANLWQMTLGLISRMSSSAYARKSDFFLNKFINSAFLAFSSPCLMNLNFSTIAPIWIF